MGDYTKLSTERAREILELYGLNQNFTLTPLSLGISNSNYKIEFSNKSYLLKVSNDKNEYQLTEEQNLLLELKKTGYPYSIVGIKTINGDLVYKQKGLFGVLFPFVEGIPPGPSDKTCFQIGMGLGKLHKISSSLENKVRSYNEIGQGPNEIEAFSKEESCPFDFKELFNNLFPNGVLNFLNAAQSRSLIHGDLYYDNTLFENSNLSAVLDFEQAGIGSCLFDLGISISGTCIEKGRINPSLVKSYLDGYSEGNELLKKEKSHITDAILLGLFSIAMWRIKRFKEGNLDPTLKDSYKELLNKAQAFYQLVTIKGIKFEF